MEVPAVFAGGRDEGLVSYTVQSGHAIPSPSASTMPFEDMVATIPRTENREPVVVIDWDSVSQREFHADVVKRMRVRGRDIWFMTWIETVEDVMDAFNTNADTVLAPLHGIRDIDELKDIISVSDGVLPVLFVSRGKVSFDGRRHDVRSMLGTLESLGFYKTVVLDTDDSISTYEWGMMNEIYPATIPFTVGDLSNSKPFSVTIIPV